MTNYTILPKDRPLWQTVLYCWRTLLCDWLSCGHFVPNHWQKFNALSLAISADRDNGLGGSFFSGGYQYSLLWSWRKNEFQHIPNHVGRGCWASKQYLIHRVELVLSTRFRSSVQNQANPTVISSLQMNGPLVVPIWIHWTIDCGTTLWRLPVHFNIQLIQFPTKNSVGAYVYL